MFHKEVQTEHEGGERGFLGTLGALGKKSEEGSFRRGNSMCVAQRRKEHLNIEWIERYLGVLRTVKVRLQKTDKGQMIRGLAWPALRGWASLCG